MAITLNGTSGITFPTGTTQVTAAPGGGTNTTSAVDITLTNTSTQVQYVAMTAVDKFVILPNATTLGDLSPVFTVINTGQYPFHIKDNAGNIIYYNLIANQTLTVTLVDNATANGVWATENGLLQLGVGLPQISSITAIYESNKEPVVAMLSATQALVFFQPTTTSLSVVLATISGTTVTYGTAVSVAASGVGETIMRALAFNATTGIICYLTTGTVNWVLRAVTVSGSTVTVGAATNLTSSNGALTLASGYMAMLDSTTGFVGYATSAGTTLARAFTVSGTTITLGTAVTLSSVSAEFYSATQIATGKVLVSYTDTTYKLRACTNSGTTLTFGTAVNATTILSSVITQYNLTKIATDAAAGSFSGVYSGGVTVSGTTIGTQTETLFGTGAGASQLKIKYLSDGLQLAISQVSTGYFVYLLKGNATVGIASAPIQKVGLNVGGGNPNLDVNGGNKGIIVSVANGFVASQIVGVLY
jgi:hypothetical protein